MSQPLRGHVAGMEADVAVSGGIGYIIGYVANLFME